jgi:hypothetical protein
MKTIAVNNLQDYFFQECEAHGLIRPKRIVVEVAVGMAITAAVPLVLGALKLFLDNQDLHRETQHLNRRINTIENEYALMNKTFEVSLIHIYISYSLYFRKCWKKYESR